MVNKIKNLILSQIFLLCFIHFIIFSISIVFNHDELYLFILILIFLMEEAIKLLSCKNKLIIALINF